MRISDIIAHYIEQEIERQSGSIQLSRNELAEQFNCVPSQINYVLMTRFTPEHGYVIDSRRGGGGYIRISRIHMDGGLMRMHIVNAIGDRLDPHTAAAFLANLRAEGILNDRAVGLLAAAMSEGALLPAPREVRDALRASILKRCLLAPENN